MALLTEPGQLGKGLREDLADIISEVDYLKTPFCSMAPKGKDLGNTLFRWQADSYEAAVTPNIVDGVDYDDTDNNPKAFDNINRDELANRGHFFRRLTRVSQLAEGVSNIAGPIKSELARGVSRKLIELKRDMELTFLGVQDATLDNGTTVGYGTAGMGLWIHNTGPATASATAGGFVTPADHIETTATTANITEATIQNILLKIWEDTGDIAEYSGFVGSTLKKSISGLADASSTTTGGVNIFTEPRIRTMNREQGDRSLRHRIDIYEGDFGSIHLIPDVFMPTITDMYLIPIELTEIRYGMLPHVKKLPDSGAGPARMIQAFAGLCVKNPVGFGKFDLAT